MSYRACDNPRAMITKILLRLKKHLRAIRPQIRSEKGFESQLEFRF